MKEANELINVIKSLETENETDKIMFLYTIMKRAFFSEEEK